MKELILFNQLNQLFQLPSKKPFHIVNNLKSEFQNLYDFKMLLTEFKNVILLYTVYILIWNGYVDF